MKKIKRIPYGKSDFEAINAENRYYVDKTIFIPELERTDYQFLIRPRRFGKSLFLSTLHSYYDILNTSRFEELFQNTYILKNPTEEKTSYMVLTFNFSAVNPDINEVESSFNTYCNIKIDGFVERYSDFIDKDIIREVKQHEKPSEKLKFLSDKLKHNKIKMYIMIDEYDNFANTIIARYGQISYEKLTHSEGFFRYFFNVLKDMTSDSGSILARLFITGVSPITLDDVTSGFNIARNITINPNMNDILGFTQKDVEDIVDYYTKMGVFTQNREKTLEIMKDWYDGYRFSTKSKNTVYNSDMILYYMMESYDNEYGPDSLLDENIRIGYKKLEHFLTINKKLNGNFNVLETIITENKIIGDLVKSFPLKEITKRDNFISLLFYFGLITIEGKEKGKTKFVIPNNTVKELMYGFIRDGYRDVYDFNIDVYKLHDFVANMAYDGDYRPAFEFVANEIKRIIVLRDFIDGERIVQAYFLSLFSITNSFIIDHEKEQNLGYSDMQFRPFYAQHEDIEYGYLVEFKYISPKEYDKGRRSSATTVSDVALQHRSLIDEFIKTAINQLKKYSSDESFKKEYKLAPYGNKHLKKLIVIFVGGEMKLLKEVE